MQIPKYVQDKMDKSLDNKVEYKDGVWWLNGYPVSEPKTSQDVVSTYTSEWDKGIFL